jgi:xanthine dehydrogenase YagS FAD-binding subunit
MKAFDYAIAENRAGALAALKREYKPKAGGIDLLDMLKERIEKSEKVVAIHQVKDLKGISEENGALMILPLTTLREIGESDVVKKKFAALSDSCLEAASPQIREVASAGGNLLQRPRCWYFRSQEFNCLKKGGGQCFAVDGENRYHAIFGEGPCHIVHPSNLAPAFVAGRGEVKAVNAAGEERVIKADDFFVMPDRSLYAENVLEDDELLTAISFPKLPERSAFVAIKEKQGFDWPIASCAAALVDGKWNVVLGHVAPKPWRAAAAEELLAGVKEVDNELATRAAEAAVKDAEPMSRNEWRVALAKASVRRALLKASGKEWI